MSSNSPRFFWPLLVAAMVAASIWASPFRYDYGNGGRYLLVVAKKMDPGLFPRDPVVAVMERFDSLFYRALPKVLSGPGQFEKDLFKIYVGMKMALVLSLCWLIWTLAKEPLAAVLLLAWSSQNSAAFLGGIPVFTNTVTHSEIVQALGILAIACAARRQYWGFWLLACGSLFIHSLVTVHLLACVFPVLLMTERQERVKFLLGAAGFGVCFLCYMHWMTPPPMSREEAGIFTGAKGNMLHISPLVQGKAYYLKFGLMLALGIVAQRRWLAGEPRAKMIVNFAITGTIVALALGLAAVIGRNLSMMQLQPMRIFFWVTLFLMVIIAWAAGAAFNARDPVAWALAGVVVFSMLDSPWALAPALAGIAGCVLDWFGQRTWIAREWARRCGWLPWVFAVAVAACALSGSKIPPQSLRDPWLLVPALGLLLLVKLPVWSGARALWPAFGLCVCVAAINMQRGWRGVEGHNRKSIRHDWLAVCDWCEKNSGKDDLFLTPPVEDNFRLHALRSPIGEEMSALVWVSPSAYKTNMEMAAAIKAEFKNGCWDLNGLRNTARTKGARYVLVDGPFKPAHQAAFIAGNFSLHRVDDDNIGN